MADVYRIQAVITLGGNIAPELSKILKTIDQTDKGAKNVTKSIGHWSSPIDRAAASMGKFAREVANARKGLGTVDREVAKMRSSMAGLKAPAAGLDREMQKWATAIGRPLAEMRTMRTATQGVGSAARGVSRSIDSWAGRITKAASAMQKMQHAAANVHLPNIPHGVGGGTVGGGGGRRRGGQRGSGGTALQPRAHGAHGAVTDRLWRAEMRRAFGPDAVLLRGFSVERQGEPGTRLRQTFEARNAAVVAWRNERRRPV
ncbi:hypothetical protein R1A27_31555 (plasmid) [Methylobacterium sp. NMS12]|uniref:hypothetical protein n=1 Tax=Methylobacterium sp. NMS12 TaxID=3079766 RepID=UPI003F882BCA